ncbi:hypothetical protein TI05_18495, partial [Achromatium sp. WMS3]
SHYTKIPWNLLLGKLLYFTLEPVQVEVKVDVSLLSETPKADILIVRRSTPHWTDEQRQWLADGLRHTESSHLLIEFKYTEGVNLKALQQLNAYDYFYRIGSKHSEQDVACFLISASTPQGDWQQQLGFIATEWPGVYQGTGLLLQRVQIILLNELSDAPNNVPIKCFASKRKVRNQAFVSTRTSGFIYFTATIERFIAGLWRVFMPNAPAYTTEITPERVMEMGQEWIDAIIDSAPLEKILKRYKPNEVLGYYKPDEILDHYKPDEVLDHYKPEQRLAGLTEEQ